MDDSQQDFSNGPFSDEEPSEFPAKSDIDERGELSPTRQDEVDELHKRSHDNGHREPSLEPSSKLNCQVGQGGVGIRASLQESAVYIGIPSFITAVLAFTGELTLPIIGIVYGAGLVSQYMHSKSKDK